MEDCLIGLNAINAVNPLLPTAANFQVNGGLRFLGDPSTPFTGDNLYNSQKLVFLPRIGFSYQFAPQTVVRGGCLRCQRTVLIFFAVGAATGADSRLVATALDAV